MRKGKDRNPQSDSERLKQSMDELEGVLHIFRYSARLEAERSDFFWMHQRNTIIERLHKTESPKHRRTLLWAPAAIAVLLCWFFFTENSKAPKPDLAAGHDQDLLVEVERALNRNHPDALAPALLIIQEMEQNKRTTKHP